MGTERGRWLSEPVAGASLVVLRVAVGVLLAISALRFVAKGWVETLILAPDYHFHYWGFGWIPEPSAAVAYGLFALLGIAGLTLAAGFAVRLSAGVAFLSFTWVELIDATYYLNHYYFLSCLLLTFALLPPPGRPAFHPAADTETQRAMISVVPMAARVPRWQLLCVRVQVGLVYVYAGAAKLDSDWLFSGQPLRIWLARHADLPIVGAWMNESWLAFAATWGGAAFDLAVVPALLWKPTRAPAYIAVVGFHLITGFLFPIGMFPWFMIGCATIMFAPDWPLRLGSAALVTPVNSDDSSSAPADSVHPGSTRIQIFAGALAALSLLIQIALPWRQLAYPGPTRWHDQGGRYAYRVMLVEKAGAVDFRVHDRRGGGRWRVEPALELTALQVKMMSTDPELIAAYAQHLGERLSRTHPDSDIAVYADAFLAVNGRPRARLIDPEVDLRSVSLGLRPKPWILPEPAPRSTP